MIGQTVGQYKIVEKLGAGGMGEVFLAEDGKLDRKVALKFLPPGMASEPDVKARFMQEAKAASALNHPNVCTIHDIQEHDGQLYIVMEYVDGTTLADKKGQLSVKKAVDIIADVADGLAAAHEKGIVHRDIKAENIMLRADGIAQVMDFGLAKLRGVSRLTREGSTVGTTPYMSPEAIQGHDLDYRTDLYSLGVVLFELVTGRLPFDAVHETAVMYEIVNVDAPPPSAVRRDLDPELDRIILECLDKDPEERYQSAKGLAKDLRRFSRRLDACAPARCPPSNRCISNHPASLRKGMRVRPTRALPIKAQFSRLHQALRRHRHQSLRNSHGL
jgi:serine/threonine protein kinase